MVSYVYVLSICIIAHIYLFIYLYYVCGICTMLFFPFWNRTLLCCPGLPGTHYEAQSSLKPTAVLFAPPPPCPEFTALTSPLFHGPSGNIFKYYKKKFHWVPREILLYLLSYVFDRFYFIFLCSLSLSVVRCTFLRFYYFSYSLCIFKAYSLVSSYLMLCLNIMIFTSLKSTK